MSGGGDTPSTKTLWCLRGGDGFVYGQFQDGKLMIEGPSEDKMYITNENGKIWAFEEFTPDYEQGLKEEFAQYFGEIESVQVLATGHEINYVVPNWAEYKLLN